MKDPRRPDRMPVANGSAESCDGERTGDVAGERGTDAWDSLQSAKVRRPFCRKAFADLGRVKCDRPPPGSDTPGVIHKDVCSHCQQLGLPCEPALLAMQRLLINTGTFDYKPKKRGPPNL